MEIYVSRLCYLTLSLRQRLTIRYCIVRIGGTTSQRQSKPYQVPTPTRCHSLLGLAYVISAVTVQVP